ncbi:hypothetical protein RE628_17760 [Paenibacillus sp. D2_2]|uniref:glycosyltransferase family 2 protein n=1 Tax=Paenibacillus sp. D2_2 TaxID=3073092 RepID=UPI002815208E|nr:hypothetical protein [Paenibacillus sp. D2_2]WMT39299.1 hypothetical protein RE628_17760 [Paenibacillus sp. D2_2]
MAKVFIGAPVRNRDWVLGRHLEALKAQDVDKQFCYILNDSEDETEQVLIDQGIPYITHNLGKKYGHLRGSYSYQNLALLRNILLHEFLKSDCDYLFSIDTDIIISDGSLQKLINNEVDVCSMLIRNHPKIKAHNAMISGRHILEFKEGLIPVDLTGAVYLIKREVVEAGVRYALHPIGEDEPFCEHARRLGFKLFVDTRLRPIHAYTEGAELVAKVAT